MSSARKYIAKCRRRGYNDEKIRSSVAGKSPFLRDGVLQLLASETDSDIEKTLAADESAEQDSEILEVEAMAEYFEDTAETGTGSAEALTPEMIDDMPPADINAVVDVEAVPEIEPETEKDNAANSLPDDIHWIIEDEIVLPPEWAAESAADASQKKTAEDTDDLARSTELLTAAYARTGGIIADAEEENDTGAYEAPQLTLINCVPAAPAADTPVLRPAYAISPEETAERLAASNAGAAAPVIDFAAKALEISSECWQGTSEDFDAVARPAESEWLAAALAKVRCGADNDEQALREEIFSIQRNLVESEDGLHMLEMEAEKLRESLRERDIVLEKQRREIDSLKTLQISLQTEKQHESASVATMQKALLNTREAGEQLRVENTHCLGRLEQLKTLIREHEDAYVEQGAAFSELQIKYEEQCRLNRVEHNTAASVIGAMRNAITELQRSGEALEHDLQTAGRDLAALREHISGRDNAITAQSREIVRLQALVEDLSAGADALIANNVKLEAENATQRTAIAEQQTLLAAYNQETLEFAEKTVALSSELAAAAAAKETAENARQVLADKLAETERAKNVLETETVPNLQKDKEDLVQLVGEEIERAEEYNNIISLKSRRLTYSMTAAAAACVAMVLVPIFSFNSLENKEMEMKNAYNQKYAQLESTRTAWENERTTLNNRLQRMQTNFTSGNQKFSAERQQLMGQLTALQTALRTTKQELAESQQQLTTMRTAELARVALEKEKTDAMQGTAANVQYNAVKGVEEWRARHKGNTDVAASADSGAENVKIAAAATVKQQANFKIVKVKRGEGLSQLLWRVCGRSNPQLVKRVAAYNGLPTDSRGNPLLKVGQEIKLPDVQQNRTAMAR